MGESWTGVAVGGSVGREDYSYALLDLGYLGLASARFGMGYFRSSEHEEGLQTELSTGIVGALVYGRLRIDPGQGKRWLEFGAQVVIPVCEGQCF
jgi:hypothetical protein